MKLCRLLVVVAIVGCFGQGNTLPEPAPAGTPGRVLREPPTDFYVSRGDWQRTPWYRIADAAIDLPVLVLVADDGSACIVSGKVWAVAQSRQRWPCSSSWRLPRP